VSATATRNMHRSEYISSFHAEDIKEEEAEEEDEPAGDQDDIFELEGLTEAQMVQHLHVGDAAQQQPHRSGWEGIATVESAADVRFPLSLSRSAAYSVINCSTTASMTGRYHHQLLQHSLRRQSVLP